MTIRRCLERGKHCLSGKTACVDLEVMVRCSPLVRRAAATPPPPFIRKFMHMYLPGHFAFLSFHFERVAVTLRK